MAAWEVALLEAAALEAAALAEAARAEEEAQAAEAALMVLEMVPADLAGEITTLLKVCATIGIGAGKDCDGQVLVLHDMLGVYPGKKGRFVKDFMAEAQSIDGAVTAYVKAVKDGLLATGTSCLALV